MNARDALLKLLKERRAEATICPSEVARALAAEDAGDANADDWRRRMPEVHAATDALLAEDRIALRWKGRRLPARAGPYRIGRGGREGS